MTGRGKKIHAENKSKKHIHHPKRTIHFEPFIHFAQGFHEVPLAFTCSKALTRILQSSDYLRVKGVLKKSQGNRENAIFSCPKCFSPLFSLKRVPF